MSLSSKDISVVVQGGIEPCTANTLKSIRRFLPDAELILSTWKEAAYQGLDYDKLVLSDDPGAVKFDLNIKKANNINRIIVSSQAGINQTSRKYILLLRSDLLLVNDNVLKFTDNFKRKNSVSLFKQRIFSYEMFSIKFEKLKGKRYHSIFHISDWCRFGLAEDIKKLYNIKIVKEPDFSQFFVNHFHDKIIDIWPERMWKMSPEQYITSENAKKIYPRLDVVSRLDWREEVLNCSDEFIVNNFIVKSIKEWGIITQKENYKNHTIKTYTVTAKGAWLGKNWLLDYQKYCNPNFVLPFKYTWKEDLHIQKYVNHFQKHFCNFWRPVSLFLRWINHFISCLYYLIIIIFISIYYIPKFIYIEIKKGR